MARTGVSALKARFENPSRTSSPSSPSAKGKKAVTQQDRHNKTPPSSQDTAQANATAPSSPVQPETTPPFAASRPASVHDEQVTTSPQAAEMSASVGAVSLIDPDSTIETPFHADNSLDSDSEAQNLYSRTLQAGTDDGGSSGASEDPVAAGPSTDVSGGIDDSARQEDPQPPSPPSEASNARFSAISLSSGTLGDGQSRHHHWASTAALGSEAESTGSSSRRTTTTRFSQAVSKPEMLPAGESLTQSAMLRGSRVSVQLPECLRNRADSTDQRSSLEGIEKLKKEFERLHQKHEGSASAASSGQVGLPSSPASDRQVIAEAPRTIDGTSQSQDGQDGIDWEFWGRIMSNYQEVAQENPLELSRAIQSGIPSQLRGLCWQLLSASKDEEMEIIYAYYLRQTSSHEKQIRKDLSRTFPEQDYFRDGKGVGQENLFNVVKAYSLYDEECGYCQGMQFIVGPLLLNMPDEEAFSTLVRLMKSYGLRGHFEPNMPALQLRLFQFDRLLEDILPLLHRHLVRQGVKTSMYASQWFMTLFSYRFPLEFVYRILDSVFAEGIEAIFRFAVALMRRSEDALLELTFEDILEYLKGPQLLDHYRTPSDSSAGPGAVAMTAEGETEDDSSPPSSSRAGAGPVFDVNAFACDAYAMGISPFTLDGYAAEYDERTRAANAHRREVEALRLVNRNLAAKVASLEEQLQQISAEHVDLVKQVVMSKIAKEEMEEELIRFKMQASSRTKTAESG